MEDSYCYPTHERFDNFYFDRIKMMLDDAVAQMQIRMGWSLEECNEQVCKEADLLSKGYKSGRKNLRYDVLPCRVGYLHTYVGAHAYMFELGLRQESEKLRKRVRQHATLKIASVGGGPGTELLGTLKLLTVPVMGRCTVVFRSWDVLDEWDDVFGIVARHCSADALRASRGQVQIDAQTRSASSTCDIDFADEFGFAESPDIVSLQFVLSEHKNRPDDIVRLLQSVSYQIDHDALVVVTDSNDQRPPYVREMINNAYSEAGLEPIHRVGIPRYVPDNRSALVDYNRDFDRNPRIFFYPKGSSCPFTFVDVLRTKR